MWTIEEIEDCGFKLVTNHKLWCHFKGHGFDVYINLDTTKVKGNYFNFHSLPNTFRGHFKATLNNKEELLTLLSYIE